MANNAKHPQITLLLTRPQLGSDAFWQALPDALRRKLMPVISPLVRIEPTNMPVPDGDVVFSSANGVLSGPAGNGRKAFCIGAITTAAATEAGWDAQHIGNTADELVSHLIKITPKSPLLHLSGTHTRGEIAPRLTAAGVQTRNIAVYDQILQPLSDKARDLLGRGNPVILPLFSPRTAHQFAKEFNGHAALHIIALSPAVASSLNGVSAQTLHICAAPTRIDVVEAMQNVTATLPLG